jgi:hypothetical protein
LSRSWWNWNHHNVIGCIGYGRDNRIHSRGHFTKWDHFKLKLTLIPPAVWDRSRNTCSRRTLPGILVRKVRSWSRTWLVIGLILKDPQNQK